MSGPAQAMSSPQSIPELPIAEVRQYLAEQGVDLTSFFDEDVKPRQPPDPTNSERKLLDTQRPTRILNPFDYAYPHGVIRGVAALVEHTNGDLRKAQTAVREAIRKRKSNNRGPSRLVVELLPHDLNRAIVILGGASLRNKDNDGNNKRDAASPAPDEPTPKHQRPSEPKAVKPKVVHNLARLPVELRHLLKSLGQIKSAPGKPDFPVQVRDNELAAFSDFTIAMSTFRYTVEHLPPFTDPNYDDEVLQVMEKERSTLHAHKHWRFHVLSTLAARI
ncbi:uncharacterized protein J3D65DRAFT_149289 [Phyllosticta citribraziliensis]|uniref:Uncharacterized protein n=1 Tax=Phyllosticta citribraziliensis TaxID=989973 RepID=A0ABR1L4N0_9PEZI